ncbi:MAG TPA: heavy-metal-associated domain-containing protein [Burkholderiales bacterium]|nr:heavy-metal-associated domain-containing protein [Burkholderiales bacterium]
MTELDVQNVSCDHCVKAVTRAVKAIDPHASVDVDLARGRVRVGGGGGEVELIKALDEAGYPATPARD